MATPRCRGVRCSHPWVPVSKGRPPLTLLVQILCFIESELSLLLLPSRRSPLSRSLLRLVRSFHGCQTRLSLSFSLSLCLFLLGWFETSLGSLWILLIKQHRRAAPTKRRLTGVTRVSLFGADERGKFARLPTLSAERKRVPPSDPGFLKRDKREGTALLIVPEGGLPLCHGFKNRAQHCRLARTS